MNAKQRFACAKPGDITSGARLPDRAWCIRVLMVAFLTLITCRVQAQDIGGILQQERDVKVAIIFKLLRFVEWPANRLEQDSPLRLCVWPNEPYLQTFREIEGSIVAGHPLFIEQVNAQNSDCHVLFGSQEMARNEEQWRSASNGKSILTISDVDDFARRGGMIHLMMKDQRVSFAVNVNALENAELRMSALVLNLAKIHASDPALPQIQIPVENSSE